MLEAAQEALIEGEHLVAQAPTGIGKTAAALTAALQVGQAKDKLVIFATSKQSQHQIVVETLRAMGERRGEELAVVDVINKQALCPQDFSTEHYGAFSQLCRNLQKENRCEYYKGWDENVVDHLLTHPLHAQELGELTAKAGLCPHKIALTAAQQCDILVCDYNYLFSDLSEQVLERLERSLDDIVLVVDEVHNLPDRVRRGANTTLTKDMLIHARREARAVDRALTRQVRALQGLFDQLTRPEGERRINREGLLNMVEATLKQFLPPIELETFCFRLETAGNQLLATQPTSALAELALFLKGWIAYQEGALHMVRGPGEHIALRLLDPAPVTGPVFRELYAALLMSGTLKPPEMYRDLLGLERERTRFMELDSPFPKSNKRTLVTRELTTAFKARGERMYRAQAQAITDITVATPGNVAAFFPSYALMEEARSYLRLPSGKRLLYEERGMNKEERAQLVESLEPRNALLMGVQGGSLSEGLDYPDNLLSAVIVVGIPLPPPSLESDALMEYLDRKLGEGMGRRYGYLYPALSTVTQAMGRLIRSPTDRGVIVLLDRRYIRGPYDRVLTGHPRVVSPGRLGEAVGSFFSLPAAENTEGG